MLEWLSPWLWLCLSALAAGIVNSVAGGGTLLTFPTLLTVVPPVVANATSTVALVPGSLGGAWGYGRQLRAASRWLAVLAPPSLAGGVVGSLLVTELPARYFEALVPWLILAAALLFAAQPLALRLSGRRAHGPPSGRTVAVVVVCQFFVAVYGGYFGAGIGILMLSTLGLMGLADVHEMNALKNFLAVLINGVSIVVFAWQRKVEYRYAAAMAVAAVVGGYFGASVARRVRPSIVRWVAVSIGFTLAAYYFYKRYGPGPTP
jgi:uncharacterized membrane protein YfcA